MLIDFLLWQFLMTNRSHDSCFFCEMAGAAYTNVSASGNATEAGPFYEAGPLASDTSVLRLPPILRMNSELTKRKGVRLSKYCGPSRRESPVICDLLSKQSNAMSSLKRRLSKSSVMSKLDHQLHTARSTRQKCSMDVDTSDYSRLTEASGTTRLTLYPYLHEYSGSEIYNNYFDSIQRQSPNSCYDE